MRKQEKLKVVDLSIQLKKLEKIQQQQQQPSKKRKEKKKIQQSKHKESKRKEVIKKKINQLTRKHKYNQRNFLKAKSWVFKNTIRIDNL